MKILHLSATAEKNDKCQISSNEEITELFLNADFSGWKSEARVFYEEVRVEQDRENNVKPSAFDLVLAKEYILRQDDLKFALQSKDKQKTIQFELCLEELYHYGQEEMQNGFRIHIRTPQQSFELEGRESDCIEDVMGDVDPSIIDILQLEHTNTKHFAAILCAICDQQENTEIMKKIRAERDDKE